MKKIASVPECYIIENFLSKDECEQFIALAQSLGFEKKKSRRSGPAIRNNQRLVYVADEETTKGLEERLRPLAAEIDLSAIGPGWRPARENFINSKWRFNLYLPGEQFHPHFDSGYAFRSDHRSLLSLIIYLNDDFKAGETVFYPNGQSRDNMLSEMRDKEEVRVKPKQGMALLFHHYGPLSPRHSGEPVVPTPRGKFIIRTDLVFEDHQFALDHHLLGGVTNLKRAVILMGPPGAGKSTITKKLDSLPGWTGINFGELVREWGQSQTDLGERIRKFREERKHWQGTGERAPKNWLPDELCTEILKRTFPRHSNQFLVIDGFPKLRSQSLLLERSDWFIVCVIYLRLPEEEQKKRILNRDDGRKEDTPEGLKARMIDWNLDTFPLVEQFMKRDLVTEISAELPVDVIADKIQAAVDERLFDLAAQWFPPGLREEIGGFETDKKNFGKKSLVYRFTRGEEERFLKLSHEPLALNPETFEKPLIDRLRRQNFPLNLPNIVDEFALSSSVKGLVSKRVPGIILKQVLKDWPERREELVLSWARALAKIHSWHPSAPDYIITHSVEEKLRLAHERLDQGLIKRSSFSPKYGSEESVDLEKEFKEISALCDHLQFSQDFFIHGDPCAPNMIFNPSDNGVTGCIDVSGMGFSDNHFDLAIACWSVAWNTDQTYVDLFLKEYSKTLVTAQKWRFDPQKFSLMYRLARFLL